MERSYYYAIYCLMPNYGSEGKCGDGSFAARYNERRALAIFVRHGAGENARLVFERADQEIAVIRVAGKSEIVPTPAGRLLYLPIAVDGTANMNDSRYYLRIGNNWERIDADSWLSDLAKRIPQGLEMWKGVWPDVHTLRADAGLYREGDANCCPTGGTAHIQLAIKSRQFVVESITKPVRRDLHTGSG